MKKSTNKKVGFARLSKAQRSKIASKAGKISAKNRAAKSLKFVTTRIVKKVKKLVK